MRENFPLDAYGLAEYPDFLALGFSLAMAGKIPQGTCPIMYSNYIECTLEDQTDQTGQTTTHGSNLSCTGRSVSSSKVI